MPVCIATRFVPQTLTEWTDKSADQNERDFDQYIQKHPSEAATAVDRYTGLIPTPEKARFYRKVLALSPLDSEAWRGLSFVSNFLSHRNPAQLDVHYHNQALCCATQVLDLNSVDIRARDWRCGILVEHILHRTYGYTRKQWQSLGYPIVRPLQNTLDRNCGITLLEDLVTLLEAKRFYAHTAQEAALAFSINADDKGNVSRLARALTNWLNCGEGNTATRNSVVALLDEWSS